jgi:hypothetical protein
VVLISISIFLLFHLVAANVGKNQGQTEASKENREDKIIKFEK